MGTSHTGAEFAGKIRTAGNNLKASKRPAVQAGAKRAQQVLSVMPGVPHKVAGRAVKVTTRMISDDTASVRFSGPAHLVNNPTKPHDIYPRSFVGTRGTGKRAVKGAALLASFGLNARSGTGGVKLVDGSVRRFVHHKGTHGKHFWQLGKPVAEKAASREMAKTVVSEVAKAFK